MLYGSLRDPRSGPPRGGLKWNEHVPGSFVENGPLPHPRSPLRRPVAPRLSSVDFASRLLEAGVVATPANGFGPGGEGYVRLTVCAPADRIEEAVARIRGAKL